VPRAFAGKLKLIDPDPTPVAVFESFSLLGSLLVIVTGKPPLGASPLKVTCAVVCRFRPTVASDANMLAATMFATTEFAPPRTELNPDGACTAIVAAPELAALKVVGWLESPGLNVTEVGVTIPPLVLLTFIVTGEGSAFRSVCFST